MIPEARNCTKKGLQGQEEAVHHKVSPKRLRAQRMISKGAETSNPLNLEVPAVVTQTCS